MRAWVFFGLFVLVVAALGGTPASAFGDCASEAYIDSFDERLVAGPCEVLDRVPLTGGGASGVLRLVKPADAALTNRAALLRFVRETAGRLNAAMTLMGGLEINEVTMLVSGLTPPDDDGDPETTVVASASLYGDECTIIFFAPDGGFTDDVVFNLGHELFHCIQYATWPRSHGSARATWWVEGTAEYFAHLVIPGTGVSDPYAVDFDRQSMTTPLTAMSYENVVFFSWYGGTYSPASVKELIDAMPAGSGDQRAALEAAIAPDTFMQFAKDFVDRRVFYPGGRPVPIGPLVDTAIDAKNVGRFDMRAGALVLARRAISFRHARFSNRAEVRSGLYAASNAAGAWSDLPEEVEADCEHPRTYYVAGMTAQARGLDLRFTFDVTEEYSCIACSGVSEVRDRCLIGTWRETSNEFPVWLSGITAGGMSVSEYTPGDRQATLRADGGLNASMVGTTATIVGRDITGEVVYDDVQMQSFWSARDGQLTLCGIILSGAASMTMTIAGESRSQMIVFPPTSPDIVFGYECSGDRAVLTTPADGGGWRIELRKDR